MMVANGKSRQTLTMMIEILASSGSPSQIGQSLGPRMPTARAVQLMIE
jgi:hypothetical protein